MNKLVYNERSWAIDLIAKINLYTNKKKLNIVRAGGENTLKKKNAKNLFPDVLLYGDEAGIRVRHGWELKFPDTQINDEKLIKNAIEKANRLRVNSFLVWNVDETALYVRVNDEEDNFQLFYNWDKLGINKREDVFVFRDKWENQLSKILDDLNSFFENGILKSSIPSDIIDDVFIRDFLIEYSGVAADSIKKACRKSAKKEAEFRVWLNNNEPESIKKSIDYSSIAQVALVSWVNKFLFSHYLKNFNKKAFLVDSIVSNKTIIDANKIFSEITQTCDFFNIFKNDIGTDDIGEEAWNGICQFNSFLIDLRLKDLSQDVFHSIIETLLNNARRKVAGQYSTPVNLANLLVKLAIENREDSIIDPCCGTGTIMRSVYDLKRSIGQEVSDTMETIWASDMFQFPLQLCTIALAHPEAMGEVLQIFKQDVFNLKTSQKISFINPSSGSEEFRVLPKFGNVVSNLPFVRGEQMKIININAKFAFEINENDQKFSGRSDLFSYILIYLNTLVKQNGRIGVIASNSWLGTEWGHELRIKMKEIFHIIMVVTSGAGKWFNNADIVTNIIVIETKKTIPNDVTKFITTKRKIVEWDNSYINNVSTMTITNYKNINSKDFQMSLYNYDDIKTIEEKCGCWSSLFTNVSWLPSIIPSLTKITDFFYVERGERRGWNDMFYPLDNHGIEIEYIIPALKTMRHVNGYIANPDAVAFCCNKSIIELEEVGHTGAIKWINRFKNIKNKSGKPLTEVLSKKNCYWYEMKPDAQADFVLGINPADRIFIARMRQKGFVDQRLIRLSVKSSIINVNLMHALMNTSLGIFFIEASGFGRGLGALDLNANKIKKNFHILNPDVIEKAGKSDDIIKAFAPIAKRKVLPIINEMISQDRIILDDLVLSVFGYSSIAKDIRQSLLDMYHIRKSVTDDN